MSELETPEEADAMNAACGVWHDGPCRDDPDEFSPLAGFWAGWLAGRDWQRQQAAADRPAFGQRMYETVEGLRRDHGLNLDDDVRAKVNEIICSAAAEREARESEVRALRAALQTIRDQYGRVCDNYELCVHVACASSVGAWMEADAALSAASQAPAAGERA